MILKNDFENIDLEEYPMIPLLKISLKYHKNINEVIFHIWPRILKEIEFLIKDEDLSKKYEKTFKNSFNSYDSISFESKIEVIDFI